MATKVENNTSDIWSLTTSGYVRTESKKLNIIIPKELIMIIVLFYTLKIKSKILNDNEQCKLYDMICKQLNKKAINWNLIYRGSDDGFGYKEFWNKCNKINSVIIVIETKNKKNVFGGYTSKYFEKNKNGYFEYINDENAFIYSIRCHNKDKKYKSQIFPIRKNHSQYALASYPSRLCVW